MKGPPLVTIVVTAYNVEAYLPFTLQSVVDQAGIAWEMIVVDDGSDRDRTAAIIDEWAGRDDRIIALHQPNGGVSRARNAGLRLADPRAAYVLFLDGDDLLRPGALAVLLAVLDGDPAAAAAHGRAELIDAQGRPFDDGRRHRRLTLCGGGAVQARLEAPTELSMLVVENCVSAPGLLLARQSAIKSIGGFDEELRSAEDYDCWFRLVRGSRFIYTDAVVLQYRRHPGSKSKRTFLVRTNLARLKRKWLRLGSENERRLVLQGHAACIRFYAQEKLGLAWTGRKATGWPGWRRTAGAAAWRLLTSLPKAPDLLLHWKIWYYGAKTESARCSRPA